MVNGVQVGWGGYREGTGRVQEGLGGYKEGTRRVQG